MSNVFLSISSGRSVPVLHCLYSWKDLPNLSARALLWSEPSAFISSVVNVENRLLPSFIRATFSICRGHDRVSLQAFPHRPRFFRFSFLLLSCRYITSSVWRCHWFMCKVSGAFAVPGSYNAIVMHKLSFSWSKCPVFASVSYVLSTQMERWKWME